ncbi:hypothetical protein [Rhodococcus jostii]|uniref:Uncharacterized protein n=2 Tax=Rhodococcus jostii TaxID=132919 RepID=A0A1H5H0W2_RHOJO|nr:hypothetical protein SAMN04490220_7026 [Rhodococcus jostii]
MHQLWKIAAAYIAALPVFVLVVLLLPDDAPRLWEFAGLFLFGAVFGGLVVWSRRGDAHN